MASRWIVAPTDPRLGLKIAHASPQDPMTHAAVRLLGDVMAGLRAGVLPAPAVGVPTNLVAVRDLDVTRYVLNPKVSAIGLLEDVRGEIFCLAGAIRRNTRRARWLVLRGVDLAGIERELELEDELALQAQQAFDLLHGRQPETWLTPFHRAWLQERDPVRREMFERINLGLCTAEHGHDAPVCLLDPGSARLMSDVDASLVGPPIDVGNPARPTREVDRAILGLLDTLPETRHTLFASPTSSGLLIAVMLLEREVVSYRSPQTLWPERALQSLGLRGRLQDHPFDPEGLMQSRSKFQAIIVEAGSTAWQSVLDQSLLRPISRILDGETGMLLVAVPAPEAELEEMLQSAFQSVYAIGGGTEAGQTIYLAMKKPPDLSSLRAKILSASRGSDLEDRSALLHRKWVHVRKDGRRDVV